MTEGFVRLGRSFFDHYLWSGERVFSRAEAWLDFVAQGAYEPLNGATAALIVLTGAGSNTVYPDGNNEWSLGQSYITTNANGLTIGCNGASWLHFDQYGYATMTILHTIVTYLGDGGSLQVPSTGVINFFDNPYCNGTQDA